MAQNIIRFFEFSTLPESQQALGQQVGELAVQAASTLPDSAEKAAGLRKLLEARDCFLRASTEHQP
jgi:hypothetical protein